ncbi:MAG: Wzz/FepE/Etk N-terminal domain-containing protein [Bacteroidota bacterium]|nr:Wzz/FepE/Etk N-terminal domain-containing protein [Bacteroidota bacterium]
MDSKNSNLKDENSEITFAEIIITISNNWKKILYTALIFGLITAIYVFLILPPLFLSTATVKTSGKIVGLSAIEIPDFSGLGDISGTGAYSKELALYENILTSNRCLVETVIKFNLNEDFTYMQDAVKIFRENKMAITKDKIAGTMNISVYDKVPEQAKEIVDFLVYQLNKINTELNKQNAKNQREFIEERYLLAKDDLKKAEDSLRIYQDVYGFAPDLQLRTSSQLELDLEVQIKSEEIRLELLKKIVSPDQSEVKMSLEKLNALKQELNNIQNSNDNSYKLNLKGKPELVLNYYRLQREVETQNRILSILLPMYESSKIEEKREIPSILVLDNPLVPEKKSKPKRLTSVAVVMMISSFFAVGFFVLRNKWKLFRRNHLQK